MIVDTALQIHSPETQQDWAKLSPSEWWEWYGADERLAWIADGLVDQGWEQTRIWGTFAGYLTTWILYLDALVREYLTKEGTR